MILFNCIKLFFVFHFKRFPFDQHTIPEYFLQNLYCTVTVVLYFLMTVTVLTFFVNTCWFIEAGGSQIHLSFKAIDELVSQKRPDETRIRAYFVELIHIHVKIAEFVTKSSYKLTTCSRCFFN